MALPEHATFLVVGAGPSGLACAISLARNGCHDVVVVDAVEQGENTSRAIAIHASTMEALETIDCAEPLVQLGIQALGMKLIDRSSELVAVDFTTLKAYTRYPYVLLLPQNITERELGKKLRELGVSVHRPKKVVRVSHGDDVEGTIGVTFESGEVIRARYVIGADGARSMVRQLCGITFDDPDTQNGESYPGFTQMVLADVKFSAPPQPPLPSTSVMAFRSAETFLLILPLPAHWSDAQTPVPGDTPTVYRIACGVPDSFGTPPHAPPMAYLQSVIDRCGPDSLSSNPSTNPHPVRVSETLWSTRFRNRAAIADRFFTRFGSTQPEASSGGVVFLIGDAAHIHSPAGGQGMNLGLRDAIGLGPVLAAHLKAFQTMPAQPDLDKPLCEYAAARHTRALEVIHLTKSLIKSASYLDSTGLTSRVMITLVRFLMKFRFFQSAVAWRLSGLGAR